MKKILVFICSIFTFASVVFLVNAEEARPAKGSFNIPDDIMEQLPLKEGDQVIRSYGTTVFYVFSVYDTIDEVFNPKGHSWRISEYYIVISSDGSVMVYFYEDDTLLSRKLGQGELDVVDLYLCEKHNIITTVDSNIVVENVYFFNGSPPTENPAIYFETNLGDYVYYTLRDPDGILCELLVSANSFHQIMVQYVAWLKDQGDVVVGEMPIPKHFNFSPYKINSPDFDPNAPFPSAQDETDGKPFPWLIVGICGSVCVIAGATAFLIVRKKKKNAMI